MSSELKKGCGATVEVPANIKKTTQESSELYYRPYERTFTGGVRIEPEAILDNGFMNGTFQMLQKMESSATTYQRDAKKP